MAPCIQRIEEIGLCTLGEGPHWDDKDKCLYFVDVLEQTIHRYVPSKKQHTKAQTSDKVSFIIPIRNEKNKFLITKCRQIIAITWDGDSEKVNSTDKIISEIDDGTDNILNDGKADPSGRLWTGSYNKLGKEKGTFISLKQAKAITHLTKVGISNGLAFNVELKKFYYIDSSKGTIDQFDLDIDDGTITNRKTVFSLTKYEIPGVPDGMTIDRDGNLWVAVFNGNRIIKIDPRRPETLLETISLPAKQVTSVAFGGEYLDELYVTTGRFQLGEQKINFSPEDGFVFKITGLGVQGYPGDTVVL